MKNEEDDKLNPWWRYTWNADGSLATIDRVEGGRQENGAFVGYVRAPTREAAALSAKRAIDAYARRLVASLERVNRRTERLKAAGLCVRCGKNSRGESHEQCDECRIKWTKRAFDVRHGAPKLNAGKATTPEEKMAAEARRVERRRARHLAAEAVVTSNEYMRAIVALKTLRMVTWHFSRMDPTAFAEWLAEAEDKERKIIVARNAASRSATAARKAS